MTNEDYIRKAVKLADPEITQPSIRIVKTLGGFYRVILHGPDNLQSQRDKPRCFEADIGSSWDKQMALNQARKWFDSIEDDTPGDRRDQTEQ